MKATTIAFWSSAGLLVYTQAGYGALLAALARLRAGGGRGPQAAAPEGPLELPGVTVIVAAYAEEA